MSAEVTIIIPVGPDHIDLAGRALGSAKDQTVPVQVLMEVDQDRRGPGYMRNRMLEKVQTPYVVFLDADDFIEPTFVEKTLALSKSTGRYVYTDWWADDHYMETSSKVWCGKTWHPITALIQTAWAREVGGFDESLPGIEDTDFYMKLNVRNHCGARLGEALFHYTASDGQTRAYQFRQRPDVDEIRGKVIGRYTGMTGCCGGDDLILPPVGEKLPTDVLARARWSGKRSTVGRWSGRLYPRMAYPATAWVDPQDVKAAPADWVLVEMPTVDEPAVLPGVEALGKAMDMNVQEAVEQRKRIPYVNYAPPEHVDPVPAAPDVATILQLAGVQTPETPAVAPANTAPDATLRYSNTTVFVRPREQYDSYVDLYKLIELAGYPLVYSDELDPESDNTYIVTLVNGSNQGGWKDAKARIILFDLEWRLDGEYPQMPGVKELWAADTWYARQIGAKYVTLGSDSRLNPDGDLARDTAKVWDYAFMAYRQPHRRQRITDQMEAAGVTIAPNGWGLERHQSLMGSRAMLHIHQHDSVATIAPQRWAMAAAYRLPILSEKLATTPPRLPGVYVDYDALVASAVELRGSDKLKAAGEKLHERLCVKDTFKTCVERAL